MSNEQEDLNIKIARLEQKIDRIQQFLNNDFNNLTDEIEKMNKNFFSFEVMFYILITLLGVLIVITVI